MPTVEFYGQLKYETAKCWIIFDGISTIFMPKSQVQHMRCVRDDDHAFTVPEWIAKEKGVV